MAAALSTALFLVLVVAYFVSSAHTTPMVLQPAPVTPTTVTGAGFSEVGTLVFYPNNVGPVPYLFYKDESDRTVAKALVFTTRSPNDLSSWSGARISVVGYVAGEHVDVIESHYVSGP